MLRVEPAAPHGVAISQSPLSNITVGPWRKIVAHVLELGFLGRAVCLITPQETASSLDLDFGELVPDCERYTIGGYPYLCAFDPSASSATLEAVAKSQDFYLGPVWIAPLLKTDKERLFGLVEAKLKAGVLEWPQTSEELCYCGPDGDHLYWINPSRPEKTILDELNRLAREAGWGVASARAERGN
jgi:hypothetical protein